MKYLHSETLKLNYRLKMKKPCKTGLFIAQYHTSQYYPSLDIKPYDVHVFSRAVDGRYGRLSNVCFFTAVDCSSYALECLLTNITFSAILNGLAL